jgi:chemotaxis family two-component system response regulator Rcp1
MNEESEVRPAEVLLVEDSPVQVLVVCNVIRRIPSLHLMHIAKDGVEAMDFLEGRRSDGNTERPDLILLDINMPRKDGFQVLSEIKQDPSLRRLPVIMFTTSRDEADIERAYAGGANTFITKPTKVDEMGRVLGHFADYWTKSARLAGRRRVLALQTA